MLTEAKNQDDLVAEKCEICGLPVYAHQGFNGATLNHFSCKRKVALTKSNVSEFAQKLNRIFGVVKLHADGFDVTLTVEQSKMKLVITTYIDGVFKGVWMMPDKGVNYPEQKFLNKKIIKSYSPKRKAELIKKLGKKRAYELFDLDRESFFYTPNWSNGKTALNHMLKVCGSLEVYL